MEEAEQSRYVAQLKAEFDSCDTTASGFLDRDELTELCRKLQLDTHLPLLLHTLLGESRHARVNFEEFKDGFVAVLSRSLDFSTSEEESSYLEPVVPEEVKPKFVKGTKRYGRRSRPDNKPDQALTCDSDDSPPSRTEPTDSSPAGVRRAKLRRSTSLESVESLKSDEEAAAQKNIQTECEPAGQQDRSVQDGVAECRGTEVLEELGSGGGGGGGGGALREELLLVCDQLGLQQLDSSELDVLLRKLDADLDGRVSLSEFQKVLCGSAPVCSSTPTRPHDPQRALQRVVEERPVLAVTVGQRLLSRLDDGSGCTSPDRVIALWTEEGLRNSRDILQTLDFPLEERLSLADLSLALDNELLVSGNGIHQAALICYKTEIQHLQQQVEQACRERDKVKSDLDLADRRNLQLVREVDDHQASMETLNQSRIRGLEQEFRDRLTALRSETEQESEVLLQQAERERNRLQDELQGLRSRDAQLQEELHAATQENQRLEEELALLKLKLTEAESSVSRLHRELELLLQDKFGSLDPAGAALSHEERFCEIIKEYELQCRELRDRNDELSSEVELLKSQRSDRKCSGCCGDAAALSWDERRCGGVESDSDDPDMKRGSTPPVRKRLQPADRSALGSLDSLSGPAVSIQTELALQQLTQKHQQEVQQLRIDLETKVNFYERSLEKMRQSMEVERKDISQAFKLEISELEEQKLQAEQQVKQLQESVEKLQTQIHQSSSTGGWSSEQERRAQREQAELEQNYAREISNLVRRLSAEKDQLEAELKLKMDQEVMLVRTQLEEARSENSALKDRLAVLQQEVQSLEDDIAKSKKKMDEMGREREKSREEEERLHKENSKYREEVLDLSSRNLQLSNDNAELSARLRGDQESVRMLRERLALVTSEQEEGGATVRRLQEAAVQQEREKLQQQAAWQQEKQLLDRELTSCKEKLGRLSELEAELSGVTLRQQWLEEDKSRLLREADERNHKVEKLQESLFALDSETELLRSQLHAVSQEKTGHAQEVGDLQRKLQEAQDKVVQLEAGVRRLNREKEELLHTQQEQQEQACLALQEESHKLRLQNQELLHRLSELQVHSLEVQHLTQECENLKSKQNQLETARTQAQDQAARADAALSLAESQHARRLQELKEQAGAGRREQLELLQARLAEEQRRSQQLEEKLRVQNQQSSSQFSLQQEQYEKAMASMQEKMEEVEVKLKGVRLVLQEKVEQLKEQLAKNAKSGLLLKDLYVENSQLMKALQVTEQRQKSAEKKNFLLEEKIAALNKLLREIVPASLAT